MSINKIKMIVCNTMQVINSVKSVGKMLGILKDPEEDEEYYLINSF